VALVVRAADLPFEFRYVAASVALALPFGLLVAWGLRGARPRTG
jgi:hypothetical protein